MKKTFLLIALIAVGFAANAQERFIRGDVSIGGALTFGEVSSYGISAAFEPKFFFNSQVSVGLRLEGDALFGGTINAEDSQVEVNSSSRTAILAKGEYYFTDNRNRPFIGLMAGQYTQANIGTSSSGSASVAAVSNFGFAPEIGYTFNNFRVSGIYHFVPGTDKVSVSTGDPIEVSRNYLVIQLGFKVFRADL
jgi:hypothetical protein